MDRDELFVTVKAPWAPNLSVNHRTTIRAIGNRVFLRPRVKAWQEALAWSITAELLRGGARRGAFLDLPADVQIMVDVVMIFPNDGRTRDADNYLKSIFDAVSWGIELDDSRFIPYVRAARAAREGEEPGFTIAVYPTSIQAHGIPGMIEDGSNLRRADLKGKTVVVLDGEFRQWAGRRVRLNLGMLYHNPEDFGEEDSDG